VYLGGLFAAVGGLGLGLGLLLESVLGGQEPT
jgi:hypothetical protein